MKACFLLDGSIFINLIQANKLPSISFIRLPIPFTKVPSNHLTTRSRRKRNAVDEEIRLVICDSSTCLLFFHLLFRPHRPSLLLKHSMWPLSDQGAPASLFLYLRHSLLYPLPSLISTLQFSSVNSLSWSSLPFLEPMAFPSEMYHNI